MGVFYSSPLNKKSDTKMLYGYVPDSPHLYPTDQIKQINVHESIKNNSIRLIDMRPICPPVFDQGIQRSCTACAVCANYEFICMKENNLVKNIGQNNQNNIFSRSYLYWIERQQRRVRDNLDTGSSIRDTIHALHRYGVPLEIDCPYNTNQIDARPMFSTCHRFQSIPIKYARLNKDLNQMKQCLADGIPFIFGFAVYESFESECIARTGMMSTPEKNERFLGGQTVMAVGVDEDKRCFIVQNSWGREWGDEGYFYMPYGVMFGSPEQNPEIPEYTSDFWCMEILKEQDFIDNDMANEMVNEIANEMDQINQYQSLHDTVVLNDSVDLFSVEKIDRFEMEESEQSEQLTKSDYQNYLNNDIITLIPNLK